MLHLYVISTMVYYYGFCYSTLCIGYCPKLRLYSVLETIWGVAIITEGGARGGYATS